MVRPASPEWPNRGKDKTDGPADRQPRGGSGDEGDSMDQASARQQQAAPCCCHAEHLTDRELDVSCQLAAGLTNDQAATAMNLSGHTIAAHLRTMLARSSARNRAERIARAYAAGVLTPHTWPPRRSGRRCLTPPTTTSTDQPPGKPDHL